MALRALQGPTGGGSPVGGSGTSSPSTIPRWTGPSTLGDSGLIDDGTQVYTTTRNLAVGTASAGGVKARVTGAAAGNWTAWFTGSATTGQSYGLLLDGGTNASDTALQVRSAGGSTLMFVRGDGNVGIGTASPWSKISAVTANGADTVSVGFSFDSANNYRSGISTNWSSVSASGNLMGFLVSNATPTGFTRVMTLNGVGQAAIGTTSFTSGRALTTVADLDVFGVRVGRGNNGIASNTAIGSGTLAAISTAPNATAVGVNALAALTTGTNNTAIGLGAAAAATTSYNNTVVGVSALGTMTTNAGYQNVAVGVSALGAATSAKNNVAIGMSAGAALTSGSSNIIIGSGADVAATTDSNKLVIGDATNYVATNGGATTYYATAGALAGYIIVRLNGTDVKLPVYAL